MISIDKILKLLENTQLLGDAQTYVSHVVKIDSNDRDEHSLMWCSLKNQHLLKKIKHGTIITSTHVKKINLISSVNYILVENPRRAFQQVLNAFFVTKKESGIAPSAKIARSATLGENVSIGENVIIEENVMIGDNSSIGHNTVIHANTKICHNVNVGANCTIAGVGFGYEKNTEGEYELIPHIGNVVLHPFVEIGNNTCIDRAVIGSTILHENVKVDNLVHIAHGVEVGRNTVIIANAMIAGSVKIGENTWISPSSSILNQRKIGNDALVGMSSLVIKDVENNTVVAGVPAKVLSKK
jgi:UDP-3-O-[3-hydroxymyristoyl] glucosamine N-acyltransferase